MIPKGRTPARERLPQMRRSIKDVIEVQGHAVLAEVGFYRDGRPGEVFLDADKPRTLLDTMMKDGAIAASLALQYGCPPEVLAGALLRDESGRPAGALGIAAARLLRPLAELEAEEP